jgi:hypothetical protein
MFLEWVEIMIVVEQRMPASMQKVAQSMVLRTMKPRFRRERQRRG